MNIRRLPLPTRQVTSNILKSILKDTWHHISQAQLMMVASSLAYTTILSLIPVLAVSFAIFDAFGGLDRLYATVEPLVLRNLTGGTETEAIEALRKMIENANAGAIGIGGLIGLILTTMSMLYNAEKAINQVWRSPIIRSWFQMISSYWLFITLGPLAFAIVIGWVTSEDIAVTRILPSGAGLFLMTVVIFFGIYKWVPNRPVHWKPALISAFFASTLWNLARWGYAIYIDFAVSYDRIYGSLSAVPILVLWIFIAWIVVLSGAALTAALQRRVDFK